MEYNAYANVKKILKLRLKKLNYNKKDGHEFKTKDKTTNNLKKS